MLGKPHLAAPLFSVLLPTHNRADVLESAIRSVLALTLEDFELFVVGDGCTDHSKDVVAGMQDGRIRWFDLPKAPHFGYANRNRALREARGTYVAYMADDECGFRTTLNCSPAHSRTATSSSPIHFPCGSLQTAAWPRWILT